MDRLVDAMRAFYDDIAKMSGVKIDLEGIRFAESNRDRLSDSEQIDRLSESVNNGTISEKQAEKALNRLNKREKLSKFRKIKNLKQVRIGDTVRTANGFPMQVTGIFQDFPNEDRGTLYLDFDGNECDIWEEAIGDVEWCGSWLSVLWKKLVR